jgi:YHS domain-containing protein
MKHILAAVALLIMVGAHAQTATKHLNLDNGLAIEGYDPVSYFKGKPQKGNASFSIMQNGATYRFANAADMNAFKQNPAMYMPMYGGWCAYAMGAKGEKVEVDPETYKIVGGRLYLFYNKYFNNTLKTWNKDEATLKNKADANWQKITNK